MTIAATTQSKIHSNPLGYYNENIGHYKAKRFTLPELNLALKPVIDKMIASSWVLTSCPGWGDALLHENVHFCIAVLPFDSSCGA